LHTSFRPVAGWLILALVSLVACELQSPSATAERSPPPAAARAAVDSLDRVTADARKARIGDVEYAIQIALDPDSDQFSGEVSIRFDLAASDSHGEGGADLTLDFGGGQVQELALNGESLVPVYNGFFLTLPAAGLRSGENQARIRFSHPYGIDGTGLHRFVDPIDGNTYLYSYLWPYYANRLFPLFDQPNLKARLTLAVQAPKDWIVVSTTSGEATPVAESDTLSWQFEATPLLASYAFSLHAGPYKVWQADADGIPMRLMARQSMAEFIAVQEWFDVTRRGLAYFSAYFGIPYPFGKYDQLIVPDFTIGAMENIAAVTFSEQRYVQRQASDRNERERRAATILHEMAHMWFGDLVTHHWWNGMWLNESFATQMAAMAELENTEFDDTWHGFFTDAKAEGYMADSRVTTHPVEMPVNSTIEFFEVFDAITYEKGASVLKQLAHYVGEDNYRKGVSDYLKANAYGNTELDDFVSFQSQASGKDISAWARQWLYQPGFNTLKAESSCADGHLQALTIVQTAPPEHPTLREHQVELALYVQADDGTLLAPTVLRASVQGASTAVDLPAIAPCPVLINPNHGDWTFAQIDLDERSLETLTRQLASVPEPLSRSMFLYELQRRAMEGKTTLASFLKLALDLAEREEVIRIQQQISTSLVETVDTMKRLRPETDQALALWLPILEQKSLQQTVAAGSEDLRRSWFYSYLGVVGSEEGLQTLRNLLDGSRQLPGLPISSDLRWRILIVLAASGQADTDALLAAEIASDDSDFAVKQHLTALAARPQIEQKLRWLAELKQPEELSGLSRQRAVMTGLFPANQTALQAQMLDAILQSLPELSRKVDPYFMSSYVRMLLPPSCLTKSQAQMQRLLDQDADRLDSTATRFLREALQANGECLALRTLQ
jgi:aminopeptidase N